MSRCRLRSLCRSLLLVTIRLLLAVRCRFRLLIRRLARIVVRLRGISFTALLRLIITIALGLSIGRITPILLARLRLIRLLRLLLVLSRWLRIGVLGSVAVSPTTQRRTMRLVVVHLKFAERLLLWLLAWHVHASLA